MVGTGATWARGRRAMPAHQLLGAQAEVPVGVLCHEQHGVVVGVAARIVPGAKDGNAPTGVHEPEALIDNLVGPDDHRNALPAAKGASDALVESGR